MNNKIGRNDSCPCGSGEKYKNCCIKNNKDKLSELFCLTENAYNTELKPVFVKKVMNPQTLIQFKLLLPYHLPFKDKMYTTLNLTDSTIGIRYTSKSIDESFKVLSCGENKEVSLGEIYTKKLTIAEMTYVTNVDFETVKSNSMKYLNIAFDEMLLNLNSVVSGYQVKTKDYATHYLTKEMFNSTEVARIIDIETWNVEGFLFTLHLNAPYTRDELCYEDTVDLLRLVQLDANC